MKIEHRLSVVEEWRPGKRECLVRSDLSLPGLKKAERSQFCSADRILEQDKQEILVFFSNLLHLAGSTIAAIYSAGKWTNLSKKALKTNLKVKTFLGTSANAREDAGLDRVARHADFEVPTD